MPKLFISYRRADSRTYTGRIYDRLVARFGKDNVFKDVDNIPLGADFPTYIDSIIVDSEVLLIIIGQQWITMADEGGMRRIDSPDDFVRLEIEAGLRNGKCILIPVLVDNASMPNSSALPDSIRKLAHKNAAVVRDDPDFHRDIDRLLDGIEGVIKSQSTPVSAPKRSRVYDIMPAPFVWIDIPSGEVRLKEGGYVPEGGQWFDVPAFAIAKYPVTNAQFAKFIDVNGYRQKKWWTEAGWEVREKEKWIEPRFWNDAKWNGADYPVVGVSWYEALAFCAWLSEISGDRILLPTEQQWQRAAQGDDGRVYPWGNEWDSSRCNNSVGKDWRKKSTSPIAQHEDKDKGDSYFDVTDMAGNVWEWCLNVYSAEESDVRGTEDRVLRGGSWGNDDIDNFAVTYRSWVNPRGWADSRGFRLALSLTDVGDR
jgi:formylglycine-generating enzyme required for sulfatase activity